MTLLLLFFSIYGLAFLFKESSGPFDVMDRVRNLLMRNKYVGVFFYKLLSCWYCVGCHCGWIIYILSHESYTWQFFVLWTIAGGAISLILNEVRERLTKLS